MDTLEEIEDEQNHIKEHIREIVRHFRRLEIQKAKLGDNTPPNIHTGIEDDKRMLKQIDQKRESNRSRGADGFTERFMIETLYTFRPNPA